MPKPTTPPIAGIRTSAHPRSTTRETCAASGCPVCQSQINSGKREHA